MRLFNAINTNSIKMISVILPKLVDLNNIDTDENSINNSLRHVNIRQANLTT